MRASDPPARYAVEVDVLVHRRLDWADVGALAHAADVDVYRIPPGSLGRPRYRLVGTLPSLRTALLAWSGEDDEPDYYGALEQLIAAVPISDVPALPVPPLAESAASLRSKLTGMPLVGCDGDVPLWVRYAGHLHEVHRVVEEAVGVEGSPPGAAVPYRARQRVVVLDLDPPHALAEVALAVSEVTS